MGIPKFSKRQLYDAVADMRNNLDVSSSDYPLNLIQLARDTGLSVDFSPFKTSGLHGVLVIGENHQGHIVLDSKRHVSEQNFFCGHEMMHFAFHVNGAHTSFQCYEKVRKQQNCFAEWQANEGSAEFLVPYAMFIPDLLDAFNPLNPSSNLCFIRTLLAEKYHVSEQVIKNRIESLKYEIHQVASGLPISDIQIMSKTQLGDEGIHIRSCNDLSDERMIEEDAISLGRSYL